MGSADSGFRIAYGCVRCRVQFLPRPSPHFQTHTQAKSLILRLSSDTAMPGTQPDVSVGRYLISRALSDTLWLSRVQTEISWSRSDSVQNGTSRRGDGPLNATKENTARLPFHARCRVVTEQPIACSRLIKYTLSQPDADKH